MAVNGERDPDELDVLGLVPAAGRARRLGPLPCSKELLPVGLRPGSPRDGGGPAVQVACHGLLERLRQGGIRRIFMVLDAEKVDIPRYLAGGKELGVDLAYLALRGSRSVPETLDHAYPFVAGRRVAVGFPDTLFEPADAFARLVERQAATGADLALGLFPAPRCWTTDMVEVDPRGRVRRVEVRPDTSDLAYNWLIAVWGPRFTDLLHGALGRLPKGRGELQLGEIFARALAGGLEVVGLPFPEGSYRDLGTPEELEAALRNAGLEAAGGE